MVVLVVVLFVMRNSLGSLWFSIRDSRSVHEIDVMPSTESHVILINIESYAFMRLAFISLSVIHSESTC
jgi:hypothetical protein